jgi:ankyrin repeat protein
MSAIFNKTRVLEAHLSSLSNLELRKLALFETDESNRNAVHYACAHANLESLELLAAADAYFYTADKFHRTAMHYAAINDVSKIIETVFLAFRTLGKPLSVYGQ